MDQHIPKSELREMRRHSAQLKSRIKTISWTLVVVAIVGGLILLAVSTSNKKETNSKNPLEVSTDDYVKGAENGSVTLIEYLDFECEICGMYFPLIKQLQGDFPNDLKIVRRYYPLPGHRNGLQSALAVEAAARQGKYEEMHDLLFSEQKTWGEKKIVDPTMFEQYAKQLGLDMEKFKQDVGSQSVRDRVQRDIQTGTKLGNTGTPTFYLNGRKIQNPKTYEDFKTLIQAEVIQAPKSEEEPQGEKVHEHADFAVYVDGKKIDFTQSKYQSSDTNPLDDDAHLHDGNGDITHKHRKGITLGYFFNTLGMRFDDKCFVTDDKKEYCTISNKKLVMYVNGTMNDQLGNYSFNDLDKILITYGTETDVTKQIDSLTDDACLYSEKCPERGTPPTEKCVGGLGDEC